MSTPNGQAPNVPVFDTANPFITEVPAQLAVEVVQGPGGQRLALTIRIPNGTVSVILVRDDAEQWRDTITKEIAKMNGLIIPGGG